MSDRLKFRVWDKDRKCFFNDEEVVIYPNGEESFFNADYDFAETVVNQCTGLKDKNGKLIYEGDILKPNSNTITKEVVYEDGSYWAKDTIYFHDKCHIFQRWIDECGYEIVGNIHQNQELLKDEE